MSSMQKSRIDVRQFHGGSWAKDQGANSHKGTIYRVIRWREIETRQSITLSRLVKRKVRVVYLGHKCYEVQEREGLNTIMLAADDPLPRELQEARKEAG